MKKAMKWYAQRVVNVKGKREGAKESLSRDQITVLRSEALSLLKTDYIIYEVRDFLTPYRLVKLYQHSF